jgi:NRAMP (natural resistance-associated macrophage protein)-like metal ion transporter
VFSNPKKIIGSIQKFWKKLGPGLITGSSDDDPSGIATYSQAGASFGLATLWTALITFPLMASIEEMCARIGLVTKQGLTGIIKFHYPRYVLYLMLLFSFPAIVLNIGADIAGMGAVGNLLFPAVNSTIFSIFFTLVLIFCIIKFPYRLIASILKYLCLVLLVYIIVPFLYHQDIWLIIKSTFVPNIHFNKEFVKIIVGILGTTISPYLFFWQTAMEVEEINYNKKQLFISRKKINDARKDVSTGMFFSNLVMYFIILTTGTVLYNSHMHQIDTVEQAAEALRPLAGEFAYLLFALGIIGTGFLAIPVLAATLSYIFCETFGLKGGLDNKFDEARTFYIIICISLVTGLALNHIGITPIQGLIYSAILYGITAPVLIAIIIHICNNKKIMGKYINGKLSNTLGYLTFALMTIAAFMMFYLELK